VPCTGGAVGCMGRMWAHKGKSRWLLGCRTPNPHPPNHSHPPPFKIAGSPTNSSFYHAEFDNFEISSASELACATPGSGTPVSVQWCGEPNTANSQWNFNWTTGLICKCGVVGEHDCGLAYLLGTENFIPVRGVGVTLAVD
jgi:hypothetical protein